MLTTENNYYAKLQLELEPNLTLEELRALMEQGIKKNEVVSSNNADNFKASLKWLEQFNSIEEVKKAINNKIT